ncbi:UNVERIFIED_CONTAM: hypothetical protein FKN15_063084 [Acipenser sinensis]
MYDTFVPRQPPGLEELIQLQEKVKSGSISMDEALDKFSKWQKDQRGMDIIQQHGTNYTCTRGVMDVKALSVLLKALDQRREEAESKREERYMALIKRIGIRSTPPLPT